VTDSTLIQPSIPASPGWYPSVRHRPASVRVWRRPAHLFSRWSTWQGDFRGSC